MLIVRYAMLTTWWPASEREGDACRFLDARRARFAEFALSLHPDKTRLIECGRRAAASRAQHGFGKPETCNFRGFTFLCGKSRRGHCLRKRQTRRDRTVPSSRK
jgi:RNA-directed DNA polymerase